VLAATLVPAAAASADTFSEKRLAQKIGGHLKQSGQLHNYKVGVKFRDGVAYLSGNVTSVDQRDTAVRLAQQVDGVTHVVSKLNFPIEGESNGDEPNASAGSDRRDISAALDHASYEGARLDSSDVTQAYQPTNEAQAMPIRPNRSMQQRQAARPMGSQARRNNMPVPARMMPGVMPVRQANMANVRQASGACAPCDGGPAMGGPCGPGGEPAPAGFVPAGHGRGPSYDNAQMPAYAWPSYASYPNYAALTYPQQYSPTAWPYIGPFYPYPQVPLAWRKVSLEWDDGWWFLDFSAHNSSH
jgi:hypothetical protein